MKPIAFIAPRLDFPGFLPGEFVYKDDAAAALNEVLARTKQVVLITEHVGTDQPPGTAVVVANRYELEKAVGNSYRMPRGTMDFTPGSPCSSGREEPRSRQLPLEDLS